MDTLFTVFLLLSSKAFLWRVCHASSYSPLIRSDLGRRPTDEQPLSKIAVHKALIALHESASIQASPLLLGLKVNMVYFIYLSSLKPPLNSQHPSCNLDHLSQFTTFNNVVVQYFWVFGCQTWDCCVLEKKIIIICDSTSRQVLSR